MEFIHGRNYIDKKDELCENCERNDWKGLPMQGQIPQPLPDNDSRSNYHYKRVLKKPAKGEDGQPCMIFNLEQTFEHSLLQGRSRALRLFEFTVDESQQKRYRHRSP